MSKEEIKLGDELYYNTTGAFGVPISQICVVLDIGVMYIWVMINGNLSPTPVKQDTLTKEPLHKVTNGYIV